ncbi:MAG: PRC-barrel domain-containing protein [Luteolibacter sp.]
MIMLFPLLAPLAIGEPVAEPKEVMPSKATEGTSASWRASEIIGTNVKAANDDTIGEIQDLIVDFKSSEILGVVISTGGFLGMADTLSSVPTSALRYDVPTKAFKTKLTKEQLAKAPQYKKDTWDANKQGVSDKLRTYRDSMAVDTTAPDNAARNENDKGLTPVDQGTSEADIKLTKDIRADLMDTQLSFNAKNAKIITRDGKVTLRGVVDNHGEKQAVVDLASKHADPSMVSDQLEVKAAK